MKEWFRRKSTASLRGMLGLPVSSDGFPNPTHTKGEIQEIRQKNDTAVFRGRDRMEFGFLASLSWEMRNPPRQEHREQGGNSHSDGIVVPWLTAHGMTVHEKKILPPSST